MKTVVGSPYWMAPEVLRLGAYDNLADIWSLGVTCIEMAEGGPPRGEVHPMKVLRMIPTAPPPSLKEPTKWSKEFVDFLFNCLQLKAQNRPSCKELLKHPFLKGAKKAYKKELKTLVINTIATVTREKRAALEKKDKQQAEEQEQLEKKKIENLLNGTQFISLNTRKRSVRTFTKVEGVDNTEDTGTVMIKSDTILVTDTNAEGEPAENDAFGVDTVIIKEDEDGIGTVVIKE